VSSFVCLTHINSYLISLCLSLSHTQSTGSRGSPEATGWVSFPFIGFKEPLCETHSSFLLPQLCHTVPFLKEQRNGDVFTHSSRESSETHKQPYTQMWTQGCAHTYRGSGAEKLNHSQQKCELFKVTVKQMISLIVLMFIQHGIFINVRQKSLLKSYISIFFFAIIWIAR